MTDDQNRMKKLATIAAVGGAAYLATRAGQAANEPTDVLAPDMGNLSYWEYATVCSLQGLANRDRPQVYCYYPEKSRESWYSDHDVPEDARPFYDWYKGYDNTTFDEFDDPYELFDRLDPLPFDGYAVIDKGEPQTVNVAANYASTQDLLPVTAPMIEDGLVPDLPIKIDLRPADIAFPEAEVVNFDFRGTPRAGVYQWVLDNQFPQASSHLFANLGTPASASDAEANFFFTSNRARDVTIAERGIFVDLSSAGNSGGERSLKDDLLTRLDDHSAVFGWHTGRDGDSEQRHISHLSNHGHYAIGASTYAANFSFHSRFDPPGDAVARFRERAEWSPETPPMENKVYLTFFLSDGDSLNFLKRRAQGGQWLMDARGEIPMGWEMAPLLTEWGPGILDYFQATATDNDHFVGGPSGAMYFYPGRTPEGELRDLLRATSDSFAETGLTETTVMKPDGQRDPNRTRGIYNEELGDQLDGVMAGYVGGRTAPIVFGSGFVWAPTALPTDHGNRGDVWDLQQPLEDLAAHRDDRPLFVPVHITAHSLTIADMAELMSRLPDDDFEALAPTTFYELLREAGAGQAIKPSSFPDEGTEPKP